MFHAGTDASVPVWKTILAAGLAGAAGGIAGNPADVILVRMTGDMYRPPDKVRCVDGALLTLAL